ncbi:MAG: hypothetical protein ACPG7F_04915 [Aggregatilineales bacterium]
MAATAESGKTHYAALATFSQGHVGSLPMETIAQRFQKVMQSQLSYMQPYRDDLGAMLATRITTGEDFHLTDDIQQTMQRVFVSVVSGARDTLPDKQKEGMATVLYTLHILILLFWLIDRSDDHHATDLLLDFLTDVFKLTRPLLIMPLAGSSMNKLAQILRLVFA